MRLDLFSKGDRILLLGEGNFSFAKSLFTHNLPINITATCFDDGVKYKGQLENVEFLMRNRISIYFDVDATKLHEHPVLKTQIFSKIIFNFPYVGCKMKIQLNRELIKRVCESSSYLLNNGGLLIISLCNGQGGTPADNPQRRWDDSWQVTEMAAYGSFFLVSVEPFDFNNYQSYFCTGYRSQDSHFNLKGALVHVFKKKLSITRPISDELVTKRLFFVPLGDTPEILVPFYYSELYSKSPLNSSKSPVCFIRNLILKVLEKLQDQSSLEILNESISLVVESVNGVVCKYNGKDQRLCSSPMQVMESLVKRFNSFCAETKIIFFPGMFFNASLGQDFDKTSPISFHFALLGENVSAYFMNIFSDLVSLFKTHSMELHQREIFSDCHNQKVQNPVSEDIVKHMQVKGSLDYKFAAEWYYSISSNSSTGIVAYELHFDYSNCNLEALIINVDKLIEVFFCTSSWKEIWSEENFVCFDSDKIPILKQGLLYPMCYTFDITLKYETEKGLLDDDVYEVLRLSAIDVIKEVKMINEYNSCIGWSSKCYRITYQALHEPLNRSKALSIHSQLISKMLTSALSVTIK